ncbi:MAG: site-specific integrase [Desulfovibrionaceae bacterium]|nr:site-specific integrase [Desulfovibrionaceae bacterium]
MFHRRPRYAAPLRSQGSYTKYGVITFDTFVQSVYLPYARRRKRSWQVDERIARQYLSGMFGARDLSSISRAEVELWLESLADGKLAPATCNRIFAVLKTIFSLALAHGMLPPGPSPCSGVPAFKVHFFRERHLTLARARLLMQALQRCSCQKARALQLLLLTGARKSEILKARWENLRLDLRLLTVPLSKSGKPRYIPLSDAAVAIIRSLPRVPDCPWLFPGRTPDKPLSDLYVFWKQIRKSLGLGDVRIHDLRHTFASFLVNSGHSLYEVQKLLGHSDPRTTMRYAHLGQAALLAAAQSVSDSLLLPQDGSPDAPAQNQPMKPVPRHSSASGNMRYRRPRSAQARQQRDPRKH